MKILLRTDKASYVRKKQKERELVEIYRVTYKGQTFNDSFFCDDALSWIKEKGLTSCEYQIEKFYKVKE